MIKLLIYDLDGTLIDSGEDIAVAVNQALKTLNLSPLPKDLISTFVGNGVTHLITQSLAKSGGKAEQVKEAIGLYRKHYSSHLLDHTRLYPSVKPVLEYFKNRKQGVITNKPEDFSCVILERLGIHSYFFRVIGSEAVGANASTTAREDLEIFSELAVVADGSEAVIVDGGEQVFQKKPSPDSVLDMIASAGVQKSETVLIGDSPIDIETGKNAGIKTIAVTYGFGKSEEIQSAGPDFILNDLLQLKDASFLK